MSNNTTAETAAIHGGGMRLAFDLLPLALFFLAYRLDGIYTATAVLMAGVTLHAGFLWLRSGRLPVVQGGMALLVLVFGGATLILRDPEFIKLKPTAVNWILALVFLLSHRGGRPPLVQRLLGAHITLPVRRWESLNRAWALFFALSGGLNLVVAWLCAESVWVSFKIFGLLGLTFLFLLGQGAWLARQPAFESSPGGDADA
ncbi:MAG: septation protein IspZ [Magnetococcales bacterium]|nr:septation protein IspZ [Magnetococcales bacterium]